METFNFEILLQINSIVLADNKRNRHTKKQNRPETSLCNERKMLSPAKPGDTAIECISLYYNLSAQAAIKHKIIFILVSFVLI